MFSQLLQEYRKDALPDVISGWNKMSQDEKYVLTRMNNFYCGLHFIFGLADAAECVGIYHLWGRRSRENIRHSMLNPNSLQSFFHLSGSEQAVHFHIYCWSNGIIKIRLAAFYGNQFNVIFYDVIQ